jgi:hypothetical protein
MQLLYFLPPNHMPNNMPELRQDLKLQSAENLYKKALAETPEISPEGEEAINELLKQGEEILGGITRILNGTVSNLIRANEPGYKPQEEETEK